MYLVRGTAALWLKKCEPRYGSFPGFNPIVELSLTFHNLVVGANGQRQAMFLENVSGSGRKNTPQFRYQGFRYRVDHFIQRVQCCAHRNGGGFSAKK